ncbi:MAG: EAL domain-containing protein [Gammaproteobacteria bacterium]|nr:EAL domain-containing protein [Gammaproteobacteria bacterium]
MKQKLETDCYHDLKANQVLNLALTEQTRRLAEAYDITREGLWEWNIVDNQIHHNARWNEIFGYAQDEPANLLSDFQNRLHPDDVARVWQTVVEARQSGQLFEQQYRIILPNGEIKHIRDRGRVADWDGQGKATRMIGSVADITKETKLESHLLSIASYDILTGLASRHNVRESFNQMKQVADEQQTYIIFLFIDLDDFRLINDTQGHEVGDQLLQLLALRLQQHRPNLCLISRHGGDEFLYLIPFANNQLEPIHEIASDIIELINQPFNLNQLSLKIGASIGASIYPQDGDNFNILLRHADSAMYAAKHAGRNLFRAFLPELEIEAQQKLQLLNQLHHALNKQQFYLVFQPQINLHTNRWESAEVLMRWRSDDGTLISPLKFIPLAEESGHIIAMTDWLLETSAQTLQRWRRQGIDLKSIAVNIPASVLAEPKFLDKLLSLLERYQLDAASLELEITESQLLNAQQQVSNTLTAITQAGFNLAIDDFGTGYSNISQIKKMKVHKLKIDKSLIEGLAKSKEDALLVKAVIDMARALRIHVLAEGVENDSQLGILTNYGCDYIQGFLIAKPLFESDFVTGFEKKLA